MAKVSNICAQDHQHDKAEVPRFFGQATGQSHILVLTGSCAAKGKYGWKSSRTTPLGMTSNYCLHFFLP
eukprot:7901012-Karenia_brevis.AAC.1